MSPATSPAKRRHRYGGENPLAGTPQGREKFGTYTRDLGTGLDYADQRYYSSITERFLTADPYRSYGGAAHPVGWNVYSYVEGDPINWGDPRGLDKDLCPNGDCAPSSPGSPDQMPPVRPPSPERAPERERPGNSRFPKCNRTDNPIQEKNLEFVDDNWDAAQILSEKTGVPTQWILGWAAYESGKLGKGWDQSQAATEIQNYYGQRTSDWPNTAACPPEAVSGWACFAYFANSALAALTTVHNNWSYAGGSGITAAQVLTDFELSEKQLAFQAIADSGQGRKNSHYGLDVAGTISGIALRGDSLKQNGYR